MKTTTTRFSELSAQAFIRYWQRIGYGKTVSTLVRECEPVAGYDVYGGVPNATA